DEPPLSPRRRRNPTRLLLRLLAPNRLGARELLSPRRLRGVLLALLRSTGLSSGSDPRLVASS
ncbi:hypothetical protein E2562_024655, partial [Oryza meyeriana var. granulata]